MWDEATTARVIDVQSWQACADTLSVMPQTMALAVDVNPERTRASVAGAGIRPDGTWHVEVGTNREGVGWLVPFLIERCQRNDVRAVVIDRGSPAASIIDELKQAKIKVTAIGAYEMASAAGSFFDAVMQRRLRHIDEPILNTALAAGRRRKIGDAWGWNRSTPTADITPLVSCTLALWGAQSSTVKRPVAKPKSRKVVIYP
jgi:hypothetical protein